MPANQLGALLRSPIPTIQKMISSYHKRRRRLYISALFTGLNSCIYAGPFRGMKYIQQSNSSALIPKIIGTYEQELHEAIGQIISGDYQNIVDIGCAEGYYAVGFAWKGRHKPGFHVYAYDINESALQNLTKLSALNSVTHKITYSALFEHKDFELFRDKHTLVFCDIEGAERSLLDPAKAPSLLDYDLLVEIHDGIDKAGPIRTQLTQRFGQTHTIQVFEFAGRSLKDAAVIPFRINKRLQAFSVNEGRRTGLAWMWMKRVPV